MNQMSEMNFFKELNVQLFKWFKYVELVEYGWIVEYVQMR